MEKVVVRRHTFNGMKKKKLLRLEVTVLLDIVVVDIVFLERMEQLQKLKEITFIALLNQVLL